MCRKGSSNGNPDTGSGYLTGNRGHLSNRELIACPFFTSYFEGSHVSVRLYVLYPSCPTELAWSNGRRNSPR
jgi:hypothetical protein